MLARHCTGTSYAPGHIRTREHFAATELGAGVPSIACRDDTSPIYFQIKFVRRHVLLRRISSESNPSTNGAEERVGMEICELQRSKIEGNSVTTLQHLARPTTSSDIRTPDHLCRDVKGR